jgi:flagella basal body P-ring formation protein FlgA
MKRLLFLWGLVVMAACASLPAAAAAADLRIELREHVAVAADVVRLRDVAQVQAARAADAQALAELVLGPAPRPGEHKSLSRQRIAAWLSRHAPGDRSWTLAGAATVSIERATQVLATEAIESVARGSLLEWLQARSDRHAVELAAPVPAVQIPAGQASLHARGWTPATQPSRRMRAWIDVALEGRVVRTIPVDFDVQATGRRWVMQRDAAAGQRLAEADAALETADLTLLRGDALAQSPIGQLLKTPAYRGQALRAAQIEPPPAVERGSEVAMRSQVGAISLTTTARALQNGQPGQRIRVQPAGARAWVEALVVSTALVEVTP